MDEVELFFTEKPWLGEVVDLEAEVWRDERRLCGAQVGSEYLRVLALCHIRCLMCSLRLMGIYPQSRCSSVNRVGSTCIHETDMAQIPVKSAHALRTRYGLLAYLYQPRDLIRATSRSHQP